MSESGEAVLVVTDLTCGYERDVDVVRAVSFTLQRGQLLAIIGPNGAGKSTLLKSLCGLLPLRRGRITLRGKDISGARPHRIARSGVGYVPQRDNVFPRLSVEENLQLGAVPRRGLDVDAAKQEMFALFPSLEGRRHQPAGVLSGGERQMLAIARALMPDPAVLLLDEPSAGVDQRTAALLWQQIAAVHTTGVSTILVEQNARQALRLADVGYVLDVGEVRYSGRGEDLLNDPRVGELYLGG